MKAGLCFSYEGKHKEHRFWKALRKTGILKFPIDDLSSDYKCNMGTILKERRNSLYNLDYESPFRVGIDVYCSFPSPASGSRWGGVAGLRRLFGSRAINLIFNEERGRIEDSINRFMPASGKVVVFQKDAYQRLRSADSDHYMMEKARRGQLVARCGNTHEIALYAAPLTRWMLTKWVIAVLESIKATA